MRRGLGMLKYNEDKMKRMGMGKKKASEEKPPPEGYAVTSKYMVSVGSGWCVRLACLHASSRYFDFVVWSWHRERAEALRQRAVSQIYVRL